MFQTFVNILLSEPHLDWLGEELKGNNCIIDQSTCPHMVLRYNYSIDVIVERDRSVFSVQLL